MHTGYVLLELGVTKMLDRAAQICSGKDETGGILLGSIRGPHLHCLGYTRSGPTDLGSRFRFTRRDCLHQRAAEDAWKLSHRTVTFIGEWHTHPFGAPTPSFVDKLSWSKLARRAKHPMLFVIAAPKRWQAFRVLKSHAFCSVQPISPVELNGNCIVLGG